VIVQSRLEQSVHNIISNVMQRIPLENLTPGKYTLEIQAFDTANKTARRTLEFELK